MSGVCLISLIQTSLQRGALTALRHLVFRGVSRGIVLPIRGRRSEFKVFVDVFVCVECSVPEDQCWVYLLYLVYDEVALVAQNCRRLSVLSSQQVEPLSQSIHHGQNDGP